MKLKRMLLAATLVIATLAIISGLLFRETLAGLWHLRAGTWRSDGFVSADFRRLQEELSTEGVEILRVQKDSLLNATGRKLEEGENAYRYREGAPYSWFRAGTASNLGYIITKQEGDKQVIVEVRRAVQVDSL